MAYVPQTPSLGFPPIGSHLAASNVAGRSTPWKLGDIIRAVDPAYGSGEFIYLKGAANTALGAWVTYNADDYSSTLLAANAIGPVAVAMAPTVANEYGWYQIQGKAIALASAAMAEDANVYATATAGAVDDTVVAGDRVKNAKCASVIAGAGTGEFEIARPWMDDAVAA